MTDSPKNADSACKPLADLLGQDGMPAADQAKLCEIDELLRRVYTLEGRQQFLTTPMRVFGGDIAINLLRRGEYDQVLAELASDYEGGDH